MKKLIVIFLVFPFLIIAQTQYTMPSEEIQHEGTWLQWPHNFTYPPWHQEDNEPAFIEMVAALETGENVHIIVYDTNEQIHVQQVLSAASVPLTNVDFYIHPNDDYWVRDNGPIFVYDNNNNLIILDFGFNGWGGDAPYALDNQIPTLIANDLNLPYVDLDGFVLEGGSVEVDGNGSAIMTRSSITGADRNPNLTEMQIENYLTSYLGVTNFIWLDGAFGGSLDITDMHVDGFVKFANMNTIVTISNSDLMIVPSRSEGFGLVILEAWYHAKPVIGFDVPALCDIVESGQDGILVKPFIKNELLNATIEMLSDSQKIERYGRSGKIKQQEMYGLNKMVNSTIHALSILINEDAQKRIKTN